MLIVMTPCRICNKRLAPKSKENQRSEPHDQTKDCSNWSRPNWWNLSPPDRDKGTCLLYTSDAADE